MTNFQKNLNDQMSKNALNRVAGFASSKFLGFGIWSLRFLGVTESGKENSSNLFLENSFI